MQLKGIDLANSLLTYLFARRKTAKKGDLQLLMFMVSQGYYHATGTDLLTERFDETDGGPVLPSVEYYDQLKRSAKVLRFYRDDEDQLIYLANEVMDPQDCLQSIIQTQCDSYIRSPRAYIKAHGKSFASYQQPISTNEGIPPILEKAAS
ncbi:hypothetical protein AGMMS49992_07590 [Clostridia bacterium]|nr:hypothetical protein AGMMS49992_07590 [Clostridia bacterium]